VLEHERYMILAEAHESVSRGHYVGKAMTQNILHIGLWYPTLHKDAKEFCHTCDVCQWVGKPSIKDEIYLVPQDTLKASNKWAVYFIGPINPPTKSSVEIYIIPAIEYLTRWDETKPVRDWSIKNVSWFLFEMWLQGLDVHEFWWVIRGIIF